MAGASHSAVPVTAQAARRASKRAVLWQFVVQSPLGAAGGLIVVVMALLAVFADFVTTYDPTANNFGDMLMPPGAEHLLGTDQFGRDVYTRIVYGARTAMLVGFVSAFVGATAGLVLGVASAYFGGRFDLLFPRGVGGLIGVPLI